MRTCCVVNPTVRDGRSFRDKRNCEKHRDAKEGQRMSTDNRIKTLYDPCLSDKENAEKTGLSVRRIQEWKADNRDSLESLEERIERLYDPSLSLRKNAAAIGCSVNSVRKYAERLKSVPETEEEDENGWIDDILERESSFSDAPAVGKKNMDELEEMEELLKDIEWTCE